MRFRERFNKESIRLYTKKILLLLFNPRLLLCLFLGWMITNGWSYILLGLGILLNITWMQVVAGAYLGLLWIPFTPEKFLTIALAILLLRLFFPKDEKTLGVLREMLRRIRTKHMERKKKQNKCRPKTRTDDKNDKLK